MIKLHTPLRSLKEGSWFKLICGASFQYLPAIRNLSLVYTLAGADCVDVAADPAVISAARDGMRAAAHFCSRTQGREPAPQAAPWLMVSFNDGEDPHFRKAEFNPAHCPPDCPRPCEAVCPAQAIAFNASQGGISGVIDSRCYGCGRCLPLCPIQQISTRSYDSTPDTLPALLQLADAVEVHTQVGRLQDFDRLWAAIAPEVNRLKLVAISCPDGEGLIDYLRALHKRMSPLSCPVIWQADGRPMSGDIGDGTTHAAIKLGQKVLTADLPGYVQLAGGTNSYTVPKLRTLGLLRSKDSGSTRRIAGVAYGSYARVLLTPILDQLEHRGKHSPGSLHSTHLETFPDLLEQAVALAASLVSQLKMPGEVLSSGSDPFAKTYTGDRPTPSVAAFPL